MRTYRIRPEFLLAGPDGESAAQTARHVHQVVAGWGVVEEERRVEPGRGGRVGGRRVWWLC